MVRNWDTVTWILTEIEQGMPFAQIDLGYAENPPKGMDYEEALNVRSHFRVLVDGGFIEGEETSSSVYGELTWEGHDLLDHLRNDTIRAKATKLFKDKGLVAIPMHLMKATCAELLAKVMQGDVNL